MTSQSIVVNGASYTYDQIAKNEFKAQTEFEKSTLSFCRDWLQGEKIFHLNTSGSTGKPKRISISRDQMIASARMTEQALSLQPQYTSLICLDTKYIAGKMMLVRSFVTGMNIISVEPSANPLQNLSDDQIIDFVAFVPYQLHAIMNANLDRLNKIKIAIVGGGEVSQELNQKALRTNCQLYETFGMTETLSHIAIKKLNGDQHDDYFSALPGVDLKLDERGCLMIKIPFLQNTIYTNDLVELIDTKHFKWLGRWDNVINSGGAKVIPEQIENMVKLFFDEMSWSNRFFIAGMKDEILGHKVCLVIEGDEIPSQQVELLREKIKMQVLKFEVPKDILFIKKFVETGTGKINRVETINLFPANSLTKRN
jgi:O-succinylbenzoic acid--CoA ligase